MPDSTTACRSCGAPVRWIRTPAGKNHPCDAKPLKRWVALGDLTCGGASPELPVSAHGRTLVDCYVSHFETCPHAGQWRR
jgi:hypothetical protein